jgi:hypothetical protein
MGAGSLWITTRDPDTLVRVDPPLSLSAAAEGSPRGLLAVLAVALLAAAWTCRWSADLRSSPYVHTGRQMAALQRFAATHRDG